MKPMTPRQINLTYTNWRGEKAVRLVMPKRLWFGTTEFHPEPQWLLEVYDIEKQAFRDYALKDCDFTTTE